MWFLLSYQNCCGPTGSVVVWNNLFLFLWCYLLSLGPGFSRGTRVYQMYPGEQRFLRISSHLKRGRYRISRLGGPLQSLPRKKQRWIVNHVCLGGGFKHFWGNVPIWRIFFIMGWNHHLVVLQRYIQNISSIFTQMTWGKIFALMFRHLCMCGSTSQ